MTKGRIEAFSDGVIAIIITIMVLELRAPHSPRFEDLGPLWPAFLSYLLSFVFLGIYWNNHHHLFQAVRSIRGGVLWANLHLLFWLSLVPFVTAWMGENRFAAGPTALYGCVLLGAALGYWILVQALLRHHDAESTLAKAIGKDAKGKISLALYALAIPMALVLPVVSWIVYVATAVVWLIPDRRIERALELGHADSHPK
jgi:uncharacterized membrane protein